MIQRAVQRQCGRARCADAANARRRAAIAATLLYPAAFFPRGSRRDRQSRLDGPRDDRARSGARRHSRNGDDRDGRRPERRRRRSRRSRSRQHRGASSRRWTTGTRRHHTASGLLAARAHASAISPTEAEAMTLAFLERHVEKGQVAALRQHDLAGPPLPGPLHADARGLPALPDDRRQQRSRNWCGAGARTCSVDSRSGTNISALADIRESIAELAYYREHFFRLP